MSEWKLVKAEAVTLKRKEALLYASKHASLANSPVERPRDKNRVQKLVDHIKKGLAIPFSWAVVKNLESGQVERMNGQHSSAAIVEIGAEIPESLTFFMSTFEASSRKGMVELFRQFDQRWSGRSSADVAGAYQGLVPNLVSCDRKILKTAAESLSWFIRLVVGGDAPFGDDVYDLMHEEKHCPFLIWINGMINGRRELMRKEVMAAMYITYETSQFGASKFWREISFGPDYFTDDQSPGAILICELGQALTDEDFREKEFHQAGNYYRKSIKAWNAYCMNQRISSLKISKGSKGWPEVSEYTDSQEEAAA